MRRDMSEEAIMKTGSSGPLFATICFALAIALGVLYFYARDIIIDKDNTIALQEKEITRLATDLNSSKDELERFKTMSKNGTKQITTDKEKDMLLQMATYQQKLAEWKAKEMVWKAERERFKLEINTYEEIQLQSNAYLEALLKKVGDVNESLKE